jgi:hypothetical protein|tara:strand:- start:2487 stop:2711 length:225 start_codon:yes stop_codon:yes gene_type:complete
MSRHFGEVKVGELVASVGESPVLVGAVLKVEMIRYHSYLPQEQIATVMWENGAIYEMSSGSLRVVENDLASSIK